MKVEKSEFPDWNDMHITDKNGGVYFKNTASPMSTPGQLRELTNHIERAKTHPEQYTFLDAESAVIVYNGQVYTNGFCQSDEDLLNELFGDGDQV